MSVSEHAGFHVDQEALFKKLPFKAATTNVKGVFSVHPPPDGFDVHGASQDELTRQGILFRKPTKNHPPEVHAAWDRFSSRKWLAKDRVVPLSDPQIGKTHYLKKKPVKVSDTNYVGAVWSGAGNNKGHYTSIIGTWYIPIVSVPPEPQGNEGGWNSSSWVGIDGMFTSNDVLQAGIQQHVSATGIATYVAWYEWWAPATPTSPPYIYQTNIPNFPVHPGQEVYCSVQYIGNTAGSISFANDTTGQHFSITLAPPPGATFNGSSCEWVMEAPDGGEPTSSLPRFTPVVFTNCFACPPDGSSLMTPQNCDTMNISNQSGKVLTAVAVSGSTATISFIG